MANSGGVALIGDRTSEVTSVSGFYIEANSAYRGGGLFTQVPIAADTLSVIANLATKQVGRGLLGCWLVMHGVVSAVVHENARVAVCNLLLPRFSFTTHVLPTCAPADQGGGIAVVSSYCDVLTATLTSVTVTRNHAPANGAGILALDAAVTLVESTITMNNADMDGGGVYTECGAGAVCIDLLRETCDGTTLTLNGVDFTGMSEAGNLVWVWGLVYLIPFAFQPGMLLGC